MTEQFRENYFLAVRVMIILAIEIYIAIMQGDLAGSSGGMLLLLALFLGFMVGREILPYRMQWLSLLSAGGVMGVMMAEYGLEYSMLGMLLVYEGISFFRERNIFWYLVPLLLVCVSTGISLAIRLLVCILLAVIYFQQDMVIDSYRRRMKEDTLEEQRLKKNIHQNENAWREDMNRRMLAAENRLLEEKARLSQMLHDRLGHSINGSVYQLEAVKVLLKQDADTSITMIQAVIDNLRTGMDEIRVLLRKEQPKKYKLALLQLRQLCEECCQMGVAAHLATEGDLENVSEKYLEIILDNAFEAVSNALKYSKCTKIEIKIHVMNQLLRCSVSDDGIGCSEMVDGMGISGMRNRVRSVNGILDFDTDIGFTVNMLLPLEK